MTTCQKYTDEFISRFVDNEVSTAGHDAFSVHMADCPACARKVARFRQMGQVFERHAETQAEGLSKQMPSITLPNTQTRTKRLVKGMGLKLATLSTAALILVAALLPWHQDVQPGPSAIVNSVDTYGSSVMIIETTDTQHTIIWFSET